MTALNANLTVLAGKLHYVTFGVIARNITRLSKTRISHWFISVFYEPGFLLIQQNVNQSQLENPAKKASSKAMLFPYQRHNLSRSGLLDDFLPCNLAELLHGYYTVAGLKQAELSPMVTSPPTPFLASLFLYWFGWISIQLTSIKGLHAVNLAGPILVEELEAVTAHQT